MRTSFLLVAMACMLLLAAMPVQSQAPIFFDDFEDGDISDWILVPNAGAVERFGLTNNAALVQSGVWALWNIGSTTVSGTDIAAASRVIPAAAGRSGLILVVPWRADTSVDPDDFVEIGYRLSSTDPWDVRFFNYHRHTTYINLYMPIFGTPTSTFEIRIRTDVSSSSDERMTFDNIYVIERPVSSLLFAENWDDGSPARIVSEWDFGPGNDPWWVQNSADAMSAPYLMTNSYWSTGDVANGYMSRKVPSAGVGVRVTTFLRQRAVNTLEDADYVDFQYRLSPTSSWVTYLRLCEDLFRDQAAGARPGVWQPYTYEIPEGSAQLELRWAHDDSAGDEEWLIDNIIVEAIGVQTFAGTVARVLPGGIPNPNPLATPLQVQLVATRGTYGTMIVKEYPTMVPLAAPVATNGTVGWTAGTTTITWTVDMTGLTTAGLTYNVQFPASSCMATTCSVFSGTYDPDGVSPLLSARGTGGATRLYASSGAGADWTAGPINFTASETITEPWRLDDAGNVGIATYYSCNNAYVVWGDGDDIWGRDDEFQFLYQWVTGDFQISARVEMLVPSVNDWEKAGLMMRQVKHHMGSRFINLFIRGSDNRLSFQERQWPDYNATWFNNPTQTPESSTWAPQNGDCTVILRRVGTVVSGGYDTHDGTSTDSLPTWLSADRGTSWPVSQPIMVGLMYTSHNRGTLDRAFFKNVTVGPWTVAANPETTASYTASPIPWAGSITIGNDVPAGTVWYYANDGENTGVYHIWGDGHDIWDNADDFHFLYVWILGNFDISTFVQHLRPVVNDWEKAGVMLRANLSEGSPFVNVVSRGGSGGFNSTTGYGPGGVAGWALSNGDIWAQERIAQNGSSRRFTAPAIGDDQGTRRFNAPFSAALVGLRRNGTLIEAYYNNLGDGTHSGLAGQRDGTYNTPVAANPYNPSVTPTEQPMAENPWLSSDSAATDVFDYPTATPVAVGLCYTSHNTGNVDRCRFWNLILTGTQVAGPLPPVLNQATRNILAPTFNPGVDVLVDITLDQARTGNVTVTEVMPTGWTVSATTSTVGVVVVSGGTTITWTLSALAADTVLHYSVMPGQGFDPVIFTGRWVDADLNTAATVGETILRRDGVRTVLLIRNINAANYWTHDVHFRQILANGYTSGSINQGGLRYGVVEYQQGAEPANPTSSDGDLIFISQTVDSANVLCHMDDALPIINTEQALNDDDLGAPPRTELFFSDVSAAVANHTSVTIVTNAHPITSIYATGQALRLWDPDTSPPNPEMGVMQGTLGTDVTVLATDYLDPNNRTVAVMETGSYGLFNPHPYFIPTPARHVCYGSHTRALDDPTADGIILLQRTVQWAIGDQITAGEAAPAAPTALNASAFGAREIMLRWTDASTNENGFRVERSVGGGPFVGIAVVSYGVTSYLDKRLLYGTLYTYRVIAYNPGGDSSPSNEASSLPGSGLGAKYWQFYR